MKTIINIFKDKMMAAGFLLILISLSLFLFTTQIETHTSPGIFFINHVISISYLLAVFVTASNTDRRRISSGRIEYTVLMLILFFISAFALNQEMNVFNNSVTWLCVWIVLSCTALILLLFHGQMPPVLRTIVFIFTGMAFMLFLYYAVYLLPLYAFSIIGLIALGISVHTYIPALLAIITFVLMWRACKANHKLYYACGAGMLIPIIIAVVYLFCWNNVNQKINLILNQNALNEGKLPAWVAVSRGIEKSMFVEKILKTGLVYNEANFDNFFFGGMPSRSYDEPKQHDPLVMLATVFFKRPNLDETERINILKAMYDARYHTQERLWAGDKLETISVISNVKIFPEYRMAYTEKTLQIRNTSKNSWNKNEAIYTFHLSQDAVISSLSLWINGKEVPSRLTTKGKADSAYRQIVGVEQHDPSVVHWQEGNTISVRVFPCTTTENRKFRIGVTSPLRKDGNRLVYENVYFQGPEATSALETLQVAFSQTPAALKLPATFKKISPDVYQADRTYQPYWEVTCAAPQLASNGFSFNNAFYQVKDYKPIYEHFDPAAIYLDVNSTWTKEEFMHIWNKVRSKPVYVFHDKLVQLNDNNVEDAYALLSTENFSLFPVNVIKNPDQSLFISKSDGLSPNLRDLEGSDFADDLNKYLKNPVHIRMFNIGTELNPYLCALKEMRVFNFDNGTMVDLSKILDQKQFRLNQEDATKVVIDRAGLVIQKTDSLKSGNAPDHLLRLFAYNDILKKAAPNYFNNTYVQPDLLAEADQAHIVSPVSSLIVLETQEDYTRFGIEESKNGLKNASMKSSGSVPEPKEWMMIILCFAVIAYLTYLSHFAKKETADAGY